MPTASTIAEDGPPRQTAAPVPTSHPIAIWFFFWGEFAERSSFYGMKAILFLYMTEHLAFTQGAASRWINCFKGACYCLPLAGGFLADRFFGKYRTIVGFSLPYILGHVIIGFDSVPCLLLSLALLAMGVGAIKPNLSTLMGMTYDQQRPGQLQLRSDAFAMFYVSINTGSFISLFAVPLVRNAWGYRVAFLFPAGLMVLAFALFVLGKPFYAKEPIPRNRLATEPRGGHLAALRRVLGIFFLVVFFWSVIEQYDNTWIVFAQDHVNLNIFDFAPDTWQAGLLAFARDHFHIDLLGKPLKADQFQSLNPLFVMLLVPLTAIVWRLLARAGIPLRPTDKMFIGFLLTLATPLILMTAALIAGDAGRVSAWWIFWAFFTVTLAEACISVVGLELAFAAAPNSMKGFITACWLTAMACGEFVDALVTPFYGQTISWHGGHVTLAPAVYFGLFAAMMAPVTVAFVFVARKFNRMSNETGIADT